jgi:hypothetical protein
MHPCIGLRIQAPTGGNDVQLGGGLTMTAMGLHNHGGATGERPTTETTQDIIETAYATWHEGTQQHVGVARKACPSHRRHGQDNVARDYALLPHRADLSDPMVDRDCGAPETERGRAPHRDAVLPLATMRTVDVLPALKDGASRRFFGDMRSTWRF